MEKKNCELDPCPTEGGFVFFLFRVVNYTSPESMKDRRNEVYGWGLWFKMMSGLQLLLKQLPAAQQTRVLKQKKGKKNLKKQKRTNKTEREREGA